MNKVLLQGNLGTPVTLNQTSKGKPVSNFSMATNHRFNDSEGVKQTRTEWHDIVAWGNTAVNCHKYLAKGHQCFVEGELRKRSWKDKDGVMQYKTEIHTTKVDFGAKPKKAE